MWIQRLIDKTHKAIALLVVFFMLGLAGMVQPAVAQDLPQFFEQNLEEGVDRVVVKIESVFEKTPDLDPYYAYGAVREELKEQGFEIAMENKEEHVLVTEPMWHDDGYALRIKLNAGEALEGSEVLATGEWALDAMADPGEWKKASWTEGTAKKAFAKTISYLDSVPYTYILAAKEKMEAESTDGM